MKDGHLPLGLIKQASLKLEAFAADIYEILEDEDVTVEERVVFQQMTELSATMMAHLINIIHTELSEEEFLAEEIPMDGIDPYPGDENTDPMDATIDET